MVSALALAAVASVTALADDPAASWPPPPPAVAGADGEGLTFPDTREGEFGPFFTLVKQKVAAAWNPWDEARVRDPTGNIYFRTDRTTVLAVTLNPQGKVTAIRVARSSGLDFLDQTAIDAFEKAQPFADPPPGLADARGDIRFTFSFDVATGGGDGSRFGRGWSMPPKAHDAVKRELPLARGPATVTGEGWSWVSGLKPGVVTVNPAPDCAVTEMPGDVPPEAVPFFDRMKEAVQAKWEVQAIARVRDLTNAQNVSRDRCVILAVVLDGKGGISAIEVRTSSGLDFLDGMAIDAFRRAQPFAAPPGSLADAQGAIPFTFGFRVMSWAMGPGGTRSAHRVPRGAALNIRAGRATRTPHQAMFYARAAAAVAERWKALFAAERWKLSERAPWRPDGPDMDPLHANEWRTVLVVALDSLGRVVKVQLTRHCGLDFLDRLATDSIWQVKAFEDPPGQEAASEAGIHFPVRFELSGSASADWTKVEVFLE